MKRTGRKKEWTILLFCMFFIGISPPIILVFDSARLLFGFPLSFLYLYGFWAAVILLIAIGAQKRHVVPASDLNAAAKIQTGKSKDSAGDNSVR